MIILSIIFLWIGLGLWAIYLLGVIDRIEGYRSLGDGLQGTIEYLIIIFAPIAFLVIFLGYIYMRFTTVQKICNYVLSIKNKLKLIKLYELGLKENHNKETK